MSSSYDSNGNLTGISSDATYGYSWDAEGRPVSITRSGSTVNLTYDALGRMVEQNRGGSYTQVVYGPNGSKLALMNGSTLQKAFVPLPAGAQAVYNASGLAYYRHADWLGTSRLASTPSRTLYYDGAYAPYGESYSETTGTTDRDFTGQNQDTHSGLYDFMYREYHPVSGRWNSPDPAGLAAVDLSNPQSLNRYAYVMNNPINFIDPFGLCDYSICVVAPLPPPVGTLDSPSVWGMMGGSILATLAGGRGSGRGTSDRILLSATEGGGDAANNGTPNPTFFLPPRTCTGTARVLGGNPATVGQQGGVPGTLVAPGSAAAIPRQFGFRTGSGFSGAQISGTVGYTGPLAWPGSSQSFSGITDTIGSRTVPNVQNFLMKSNPGALILELVTGSDMGKVPVTITVPGGMSCPAGTS
jgi:RHS repeat-associated protein